MAKRCLRRHLESQVVNHVNLGDQAVKVLAIMNYCDAVRSKNRHQVVSGFRWMDRLDSAGHVRAHLVCARVRIASEG